MKDGKNYGITLIALVITIIVLIILASVALSIIIGEDGIIKRTKEATDEMNFEAVREKIEMEIAAFRVEETQEIGANFKTYMTTEAGIPNENFYDERANHYWIYYEGQDIRVDKDTLEITDPSLDPYVAKAVTITTTLGPVVNAGDIITMTSTLIGFEDVPPRTVVYQWQVRTQGSTVWEDIAGANGPIYQYVATIEAVNSSWRIKVTI